MVDPHAWPASTCTKVQTTTICFAHCASDISKSWFIIIKSLFILVDHNIMQHNMEVISCFYNLF